MPTKSRGLTRRPLWIIQRYQDNRMDVLTIDLDGDGGFLAVFSFKEEAETFLHLWEDDERRDWRSRETTAGELTSVLLGPCTGVRWVALDPLPVSCSRALLPLVRVSRERFVQDLMGERRTFIEEPLCLPRDRELPYALDCR